MPVRRFRQLVVDHKKEGDDGGEAPDKDLDLARHVVGRAEEGGERNDGRERQRKNDGGKVVVQASPHADAPGNERAVALYVFTVGDAEQLVLVEEVGEPVAPQKKHGVLFQALDERRVHSRVDLHVLGRRRAAVAQLAAVEANGQLVLVERELSQVEGAGEGREDVSVPL